MNDVTLGLDIARDPCRCLFGPGEDGRDPFIASNRVAVPDLVILLGKPLCKLGGMALQHFGQGFVLVDILSAGGEEAGLCGVTLVPVGASTRQGVELRERKPHQVPDGFVLLHRPHGAQSVEGEGGDVVALDGERGVKIKIQVRCPYLWFKGATY